MDTENLQTWHQGKYICLAISLTHDITMQVESRCWEHSMFPTLGAVWDEQDSANFMAGAMLQQGGTRIAWVAVYTTGHPQQNLLGIANWFATIISINISITVWVGAK